MAKQKILPLFILLLFCFPLFFINVHNVHSYGDDWSQYVREAINIADGKPYYQSEYIFNPANINYAPPQYPPGFPLLLAPIVKFSGTSILPLLYFNTFLICLLVFTSYYYFSRFTERAIAVCLAIILGYLNPLLDLKAQVLSDIACTLFSLLYLAIREHNGRSRGRSVALILIGSFAILIRTQAAVILIAEMFLLLLHLFQKKRDRKIIIDSIIVTLGIFCLSALCIYIIFPAPNSGLNFYISVYKSYFKSRSLWDMLGSNIGELYNFTTEALGRQLNDKTLQSVVSIICSSAFLLALTGLARLIKMRRGLFSIVFFLMMCGLMLVTPASQGIRYFLPAIPTFLLFIAKGFGGIYSLFCDKKQTGIAIACSTLFLLAGYDDCERRIREKPGWIVSQVDSNAFNYVRDHVSPDEIIIFTKPRLLNLFTRKRSMNASWDIDAMANKKQFDSMKADYLLYCRHLNLDVLEAFKNINPRPYKDSVVINDAYILYRLNSSKKE